MVKILVVTRHFWPENCRVNEWCELLTEKGYRVDVLCGQPSQENGAFFPGYTSFRVKRESRNHIHIYRTMDVKRGETSNLRLFFNYFTFPLMAAREIPRLLKNGYEAVLIYQTSPVMICAPGLRIGKKLGIPVYVYTAELWPQSLYPILDVQSGLFRHFLMMLSMHYYRKATQLLVPTRKIQMFLKDKLNIGNEHFALIPFTPDPVYDEERPDDTILEKLAPSFNLTIFGDMDGRLAVDTVIQVAEAVRTENLRRVRFVVLGGGDLIQNLQKQVEAQHLRDFFYFEGPVPKEEYGKYIHITDAVLAIVRPVDMDEFQIPAFLVNDLMTGRPIVASLSGEVKTLFKKAECGFSTEPYDTKALIEAIRRLYQMSPEDRQILGANARDYGTSHFSLKQNTDKIIDVLEGRKETDDAAPSEIRNLWDI